MVTIIIDDQSNVSVQQQPTSSPFPKAFNPFEVAQCECGCGQSFKAEELAFIPTGYTDKPFDAIHPEHYKKTWKTDGE